MLNKLIILSAILLLSNHAIAAGMATPVRVTKVEKKEFFEKYTSFGQCKNGTSRSYTVSIASGKVDYINAREGQKFKTGEIIMTIDRDIAEANRIKAMTAYNYAELSYKRDQSLFEKKVISHETLENARVALGNAKANLASTLKDYSNMVITADFDGEIGVIMPKVGDTVKNGDYLFSLINPSNKTITLTLPESLHNKVSTATEITLTDSRGFGAAGKIVAVSPYLSDSGMISIEVIIENANYLIHGSYLNGSLMINKHMALGIPEQAVLKNDEGDFVYKISDNNIVKQVYIKTGVRTDNMIEVSSGSLQEGDTIVLEGLTKIQDGSIVQIMEK